MQEVDLKQQIKIMNQNRVQNGERILTPYEENQVENFLKEQLNNRDVSMVTCKSNQSISDDVVVQQMALYGNSRRGVDASCTPVVLSEDQKQKCYDAIEKANGKDAANVAKLVAASRR